MAKNVYEVDQKLMGVGNCLFLPAREWGILPPRKKNIANSWGCAQGGGEVTVKIAACITGDLVLFVTQASSTQCQGGKGLHDVTP